MIENSFGDECPNFGGPGEQDQNSEESKPGAVAFLGCP